MNKHFPSLDHGGRRLSRYDWAVFSVLVVATLAAVGWETTRISANKRKPSRAVETVRHESVVADAPSAETGVAAVTVH